MSVFRDSRTLFANIKKDIEQYKLKDPTIGSSWQVLFFSAGFQSLFMYRLYNNMWNHKLRFIAMIFYYFTRLIFSVDIHPAAQIEGGVVIDHAIGTVIGSTATVGSGTVIYHGVTLGARYIVNGKRHPDIGKNVIIGSGAKILGSISVGDNAKIGANSVVLDPVIAGTTVVGIPARIAKSFAKRKVIGYDA